MDKFNDRLRNDWFILSSLVSKDFKLKYRRSILGVVWSVLNPFLMMIVMAAIFSFFSRGDTATQPFPVYLILGSTLFTLMSSATSIGASSIISAASMIKKIRINKMIFPLAKVVFELVNFSLSLVAVVIVMAFFKVWPTIYLLYLPLLLFYVTLFCAGLSLLLSALAVFFADIIYLWGVVLTAWTYATPIFYSSSILPQLMIDFMKFNPMYHYVTYFRSITMCGVQANIASLLHCFINQELWLPAWQPPGLMENLVCLGIAVITFLAGYLVFRVTQKRFILFV
ncbi:MAG: ABC transporter permease [Coriobacteriales bacterium]|jgi:ABC-2 type transport system permease protein|nr:ABC transporter permease [Coriobacteriales bacterium]